MRSKSLLVVGCAFAALLVPAAAQDAGADKSPDKAPDSKKKDKTVAKPMTDKQKNQQQEKLRKELETPYKKWLNEDVGYIITRRRAESLQAFCRPTMSASSSSSNSGCAAIPPRIPKRTNTARNTIAASPMPTSITPPAFPAGRRDRGMIYIKYGPPDETDVHIRRHRNARPIEEGGGTTSMYPFEDWRYRYIEGIGSNIKIEFVDTTHERRVPHDHGPVGKGRSAECPRRRPDACASRWGMCDKSQRFTRTDGTHLGTRPDRCPISGHERVHTPRTIRQAAGASGRSSSRIWKRR